MDPIAAVATSMQPISLTGVQVQRQDFTASLQQAAEVTNDKIINAEGEAKKLALGDDIPIHQVMTSLESAKIHLELVVQIRDKLVGVYQDLIKMAV